MVPTWRFHRGAPSSSFSPLSGLRYTVTPLRRRTVAPSHTVTRRYRSTRPGWLPLGRRMRLRLVQAPTARDFPHRRGHARREVATPHTATAAPSCPTVAGRRATGRDCPSWRRLGCRTRPGRCQIRVERYESSGLRVRHASVPHGTRRHTARRTLLAAWRALYMVGGSKAAALTQAPRARRPPPPRPARCYTRRDRAHPLPCAAAMGCP